MNKIKLRSMIKIVGAVLIIGALGINTPVLVAANTTNIKYVHDPRINEKAMEDIVVDNTAVYGFKPSKDSVRLAEYADADWDDPVTVEGYRQDRIKYLSQFDSMYDLWNEMLSKGSTTEEIARAVSAKRNEIRLASYANDPEGLTRVKKSNLDTYGNENGPTAESLFEKYGAWEKVLLKSFSSNSGMDACLGLYDMQYEHNKMVQSIVEHDKITYKVKNNDNLSKIALKYYGEQSEYNVIFEANKDQIKSANLIYEGQILDIPLQ
ncbi:MAG: LysM peptidoglycan-binding domain-containing protein [Lachnospiraceae bacterium]|nr:LysM peptidoglycan-binding domain-containing protein [Lachnospiraceae bacterium]